jgi:hypothetical protein
LLLAFFICLPVVVGNVTFRSIVCDDGRTK